MVVIAIDFDGAEKGKNYFVLKLGDIIDKK